MNDFKNYLSTIIKFTPITSTASVGVGILSNMMGVSYEKVSLTIVGTSLASILTAYGIMKIMDLKTNDKKRNGDFSITAFLCSIIVIFTPIISIGYILGMPIYYIGKFGMLNIVPNYLKWIKN